MSAKPKTRRFSLLERLKDGAKSLLGPSSPEIGLPYNVQHKVHVHVDPSSRVGLAGLPGHWETFLETSGITREETIKNPDAVLSALETAMNGPPSRPPPRRTLQMQREKYSALEQIDPKTRYGSFKQLGSGASGTVYSAKSLATGEIRALKYCSIGKDTLKFLMDEIVFQRAITHANICTLYECYIIKNQVVMAMEIMDGGMLTDYCSLQQSMPEPVLAYTAKNILMGLAAIHKVFRVHRDIKSDNILVNRAGNVKLADFGFAAFMSEEESKRSSTVGTPFWMAPELIKGIAYDTGVDVWSFGITMIEMTDGEPPLMRFPVMRALLLITLEPPPTPKQSSCKFSHDLLHFVAKALIKEPGKRATAEQLLLHPFLRRACSQDDFAAFVSKTKGAHA